MHLVDAENAGFVAFFLLHCITTLSVLFPNNLTVDANYFSCNLLRPKALSCWKKK